MKRIIYIILILMVNQITGYSIDTLSMKYYPLKVGNSWTYFHVHVGFPSSSSWYKNTITDTITFSGHLYYIVNFIYKVRVDSVFGKCLILDSNGCPWLNYERLLDSLQAGFHDSCRSDCSNYYTKCIDTSSSFIFGMMKPSKTFFYYDYFETTKFRKYVKDIGVTFAFTQYGSPSYDTDTLKGCVINGVVYGDTSMIVGIQNLSQEIPEQFSLSQNYPNPFNPATTIKFDIPSNVKSEKSNVKIIVYDVLGREVATLVNEQLKPGTYKVEWDGSNNPSGVYFYKLIVGNPSASSGQSYSETRKMVLVK